MYSAEISRTNPAMILFLIDQSGSMQDDWGGRPGHKKADGVAMAINRALYELTIRCAKEEGVRDYFDVGVIGYGAVVGPVLAGSLAGREIVSIGQIASSPVRVEDKVRQVEDGAGGLVSQAVKFPVWLDPTANGGTPMCAAMSRAFDIASSWVLAHPNSFPPIVINITDGESTDGEPSTDAERLKSLLTTDGELLLFNLHVSSTSAEPIVFPSDESRLPDDYARVLYRTASHLTSSMTAAANVGTPAVTEGAKGFVFNGDMVAVITALEIGTRPSNLR